MPLRYGRSALLAPTATSQASSSSSSAVSLVVLIHGIWGSPDDLQVMEDELIAGNPVGPGVSLVVLNVEGNKNDRTYDGIDCCAARVVQEMKSTIALLEQDGKNVVSISVTGYSLGGLVARYVLGILHAQKFFDRVRPLNFTTFASPAIGMPLFDSWISRATARLGSRLMGRTGAQLFNADDERLIWRLADPRQIFMRALKLFPRIDVYANTVHDMAVPYPTSAFTSSDPFAGYRKNGIEISMLDGLPIIFQFHLPPSCETLGKRERPAQQWSDEKRSPIPPHLRFKSPLNVLFVLSLPIVLPAVGCYQAVRVVRQTHASRRRLQHKNAAEIWDMLTACAPATEPGDLDALEPGRGGGEVPSTTSVTTTPVEAGAADKGLLLTSDQLEMIRNLDAVPQLKKHLVFFPDVYDAHAAIIARETHKFPDHGQGTALMRHWVSQMLR